MEEVGSGQGGTALARAWALLAEAEDEPPWRLNPMSIMDEITLAQKLINCVQGHQLRMIAHAEATGPGDVRPVGSPPTRWSNPSRKSFGPPRRRCSWPPI